MNISYLNTLLKDGEGPTLEFKQCRDKLSKDVYETIGAFLNRRGGVLILGVDDAGKVVGIQSQVVAAIKKDLVNTLHNTQKINPPIYLAPEEITHEGQTLLVLSVPESSQVHTCAGRIFDRNDDGDFDITTHSQQVAELYLRKQISYSENRIYPYVELNDLRTDLIDRVRKLVRLGRQDHPWIQMDDLALLKSARLFQKDYQTGKEGISMAGVLLFGRDEVIASVVPHHRTDAILRVHNLDRYDDRDDIRTNLIESYDRLMAFVAKHVADPFYLEGDRRISLRDRIFREVVSNLLIHREYLNPFPAKLIIHRDIVSTENSNNPHSTGPIDPSSFSPSPKNPVIARVFKELDRAEELGSGVRNLFKYGKAFAGADPMLTEDQIFRVIVTIPNFDGHGISEGLNSLSEGLNLETEGLNSISEGLNLETEGVNLLSEGLNSLNEGVSHANEDVLRAQALLTKFPAQTRSDQAQSIQLLLVEVLRQSGLRSESYATRINAGISSTERYLAILKTAGLVEYIGSKKTGGYFLTDRARDPI